VAEGHAATGRSLRRCNRVERAEKGPFKGVIVHDYLTLSLTPAVIAQVLEIRELTAALNYGLNKVRFPAPVRVGSPVRAAVTAASAQQKTSGVESVFTLTFEITAKNAPRASPTS
jgi:acyl dehydratase